jgi:hypothetical protein
MRICRKEPTVDELLSDPMMEPVLSHSRTTADEVRSLMSDIAARLAAVREGYEEPLAGSRPSLCD